MGSQSIVFFSRKGLTSNIGLDSIIKKNNTSGWASRSSNILLVTDNRPLFLTLSKVVPGRQSSSIYLKIILSLSFLPRQHSSPYLKSCFSTAVQSILRFSNHFIKSHWVQSFTNTTIKISSDLTLPTQEILPTSNFSNFGLKFTGQ